MLLDVAQDLAPRAHVGFRLVHGVVGPEAAEDRLHELDAVAARLGDALDSEDGRWSLCSIVDVGVAGDDRAVARHGARDVLVRGAQEGALRVEPRVVAVGCGKRLLQRLRCSHRRFQCQCTAERQTGRKREADTRRSTTDHSTELKVLAPLY